MMYNPQLDTFICVVEAGSFSKAADKLYISPPAVIKQINSLENNLGVQLFARTHRGLVVTAAGESLYQDAKYMVNYSKYEITPVEPYTSDDLNWTNSSSRVSREHDDESLRDIALTEITPADWDSYDTVLIGTPTWWYTMAPAVLTFLHQQDFTGKTVIPFMTNGGWPGHVIKDMEAECKGAKFAHEMKIQFDSTGGDRLETPERVITKWVADVKKDLN